MKVVLDYYYSICLSIFELTIDLMDSYTKHDGKETYIKTLIHFMQVNGFLKEKGIEPDEIKEILNKFYMEYEKAMAEGPFPATVKKLSNGNNIYAFLKASGIP